MFWSRLLKIILIGVLCNVLYANEKIYSSKIYKKENLKRQKPINKKHEVYAFIGIGSLFGFHDGIGAVPIYLAIGYVNRINDYLSWRIYGDLKPFFNNVGNMAEVCPYRGNPNYPSYQDYCYRQPRFGGGVGLNPISVDVVFDAIARQAFNLGFSAGLGAGFFVGISPIIANSSQARIGAQIRANLGLKATWLKKHGIEILIHIPFPLINSIPPPYQSGIGLMLGYSHSL